MAVFIGGIGGQTHLGIFVEPFEQRDAYRVAYGLVGGLFVGAAQTHVGVGKIGGIFGGRLIDEAVLVGIVFDGVDNAGHRDKGANDGRVLLLLLIKAKFIALGRIIFLSPNAVVGIGQIGRNGTRVHTRLSALHLLGIEYVGIVADTAVFLIDKVVGVEEELYVVPVA